MTIVYREPYWVGTCTASTFDFLTTTASTTTYASPNDRYWYGAECTGEYDIIHLREATQPREPRNYYPNTDYVRNFIQPVQPTPERIREQEEAQRLRDEVNRIEYLKREIERKEAKRKARSLLLNSLDPMNKWRILKGEQEVHVESQIFDGITYKIPFSGRIRACRGEAVVSELCLNVDTIENLPNDDVVLTKFLHMLNDERNAVGIAAHSCQRENLKARLT